MARSAVNCSPGARAGCFGLVSGLSMSHMQQREVKFTIAGSHAAPSRRQELLFLSALAK